MFRYILLLMFILASCGNNSDFPDSEIEEHRCELAYTTQTTSDTYQNTTSFFMSFWKSDIAPLQTFICRERSGNDDYYKLNGQTMENPNGSPYAYDNDTATLAYKEYLINTQNIICTEVQYEKSGDQYSVACGLTIYSKQIIGENTTETQSGTSVVNSYVLVRY